MLNLSNPWDVLWYICSFLAKPWFFNLCETREKSRRNSFHNIIFDICSGNILFLLPQSCTWSSMKDYMLDQFILWRLLILLLRRLPQNNIIHRVPVFHWKFKLFLFPVLHYNKYIMKFCFYWLALFLVPNYWIRWQRNLSSRVFILAFYLSNLKRRAEISSNKYRNVLQFGPYYWTLFCFMCFGW